MRKANTNSLTELSWSSPEEKLGGPGDAEAAWAAELEHRASEINSGREPGESADKVFSDLRADHSCSGREPGESADKVFSDLRADHS